MTTSREGAVSPDAAPSGVARGDDGIPRIGVVAEPGSALVPYRVRFDEATPAGTLRTSVLLRYAQDIAWVHSEHLGYDRAWYAERSLAWLVRSVELAIDEDVRLGETLLLRTAVVGFRKVWARRRTEVRRASAPEAPPVAWLHTDWVMTDGRGAPARVPPDFAARFEVPPTSFEPVRVVVPAEPDDAARTTFGVRPHELDPMDHVNNGVYLDWVEEAVRRVDPAIPAARPRRYRLEYLVPAGPGDELVATAWPMSADPRGDAPADGPVGRRFAVRIATLAGADVLRAEVVAG